MIIRNLLLIIFMTSLSLPTEGRAEEFICPIVMSNGEGKNIDSIMISPNSLLFTLSDKNATGHWYTYVIAKDGTLMDVECEDMNDSCLFIPGRIRRLPIWYDAMREYDETHEREVFFLRIKFESETGEVDVRDVRMALLPTKPKFTNIRFDYEFDWEDISIWPNGLFSFDVISEGAEEYITLLLSGSYLFSPEYFFREVRYFDIISNSSINTLSYDAEWGEYIYLFTHNYFGSTKSDTICTTDYIYDKAVVERINSLRQEASVSDVCLDENNDFTIKNREISFNFVVNEICLYDINSLLVKKELFTDILDISDIASGVYILFYITNNIQRVRKVLVK